MDKKKLMLLMGALVIAIGTALAARSLFEGAAAPKAEAVQAVPQGPKALVAQRALPVGTIITAELDLVPAMAEGNGAGRLFP